MGQISGEDVLLSPSKGERRLPAPKKASAFARSQLGGVPRKSGTILFRFLERKVLTIGEEKGWNLKMKEKRETDKGGSPEKRKKKNSLLIHEKKVTHLEKNLLERTWTIFHLRKWGSVLVRRERETRVTVMWGDLERARLRWESGGLRKALSVEELKRPIGKADGRSLQGKQRGKKRREIGWSRN